MAKSEAGERIVAAIMDNDTGVGLPESRCELGLEGSTGEHGPLTEHAHEGFILWKSGDNVIRHRKNTGIPKRKKQKSNGTVAIDSTLSKLVLGELRQAGATPASLAIAKRLLQIASTQKGAQAVQALDRLAVRIGESWEARRPGPTQICPLCSRRPTGDVHLTVTDGIGKDLARFRDLPLDDGDSE